MKIEEYIEAGRVPKELKPQGFGLWRIERISVDDMAGNFNKVSFLVQVGYRDYTLLRKWTMGSLHWEGGEVVMEDSRNELKKHLGIWRVGEGKILVTGLGLGCVVRGLLAKREVKQVTVVEIDPQVLRVVGHEFRFNRRVKLIHGDALTVDLRETFDFAWHDLWTEGDVHLQVLHTRLLARFAGKCGAQGAWELPRWVKNRAEIPILR